MRELASQAISVASVFDPNLVVDKVLMPLTEKVFDKALHIRHGAVLGVSEVIIGLSGNSIINRRQALEKAFKTLSMAEQKIIKEETEN